MANVFNLVSEETYKEQTDKIATMLAAIAQGNGLEIKSFKDVQRIVRMGLAETVFKVGDQFEVEREKTLTASVGSTAGTAGITAATVVVVTFLNAVGEAKEGSYEFTFNGAEWHLGGESVLLTDYGITVTGAPKAGDEVLIHETTDKIVFDIIGINAETLADPNLKYSLTLQTHDIFIGQAFDSQEAMYYAAEELPAGTYNFSLIAGWDVEHGGGKTYQFTLAKPVPKGGQIYVSGWAWDKNITAAKIITYASNTSTAVIESVAITEGSDGTALGMCDGTVDNLNHTQRLRYGQNVWKDAESRMYLNSDAQGDGWWKSTNVFDRKPTYAGNGGFLKGFDPEFVSVLALAKKVTANNGINNATGSYTTDDRVFLISRSEAYGNKENGIDEGAAYEYYKDYSQSAGSAHDGADTNRIKYNSAASAFWWWLRSPYFGFAYYARYINVDGFVNGNLAYIGNGLAPACVIA